MRLLRPRVVSDIRSRGASVFAAPAGRLNLGKRITYRVPATRIARAAILFVAAWLLILGSVSAPASPHVVSAQATSAEERALLEAQLQELEGQIGQYQNQVSSYQKQGSTLKTEITRLNGKIAKLNLQIKDTSLRIKDLDQRLADTQARIDITEDNIARNKGALGDMLQSLYSRDQLSLLQMFLQKPRLSDFFGDVQGLALLQNNVRLAIRQIADLRENLEEQKEQFALAKADGETLKNYQLAQKNETDSTRLEKDQLLKVTKGQETKYQQLLKETKATAAEIRKRIFQLLGGGELSFEEAYQYAKLASNATGVRPALILAVLDRESALGRNVGRCTYRTAMSPKNQTIFLEIVKELGLNPETMVVSCPNRDGVYGGALGPAQFIPSTWLLYRDEVARTTGHNPPSPWNNADAFVATALYLRDAGAANAASVAAERKAAARYYAGGNWSRFLWTYGEAVVSHAARFEDDIATIGA